MHFVFVSNRTLCERDFHRFGINDLDGPHEVSLVEIRRPSDLAQISTGVRSGRQHHFLSRKCAVKALPAIVDGAVVVDLMSTDIETRRIRKALQSSSASVVQHSGSLIPSPEYPLLLGQNLAGFLSKRNPLTHSIRAILLRGYARVQPRSYLYVSAGSVAELSLSARRAKRVIHGRSLDCDEYQRWSNIGLSSEYDVYLDTGGPGHPDFSALGIKGSGLSDFYAELNDFLAKWQEVSARELVVAAHPRMSPDFYKTFLPKLEVKFGQTARLVKEAAYVLDSGSTSVSFAVLARKPIVFCLPASASRWQVALVSGFARAFRQPVLRYPGDLDRDRATSRNIDETIYACYEERFLETGRSSGLSFSELLLSIAETAVG